MALSSAYDRVIDDNDVFLFAGLITSASDCRSIQKWKYTLKNTKNVVNLKEMDLIKCSYRIIRLN
jgi:hypothetical protein